MADAPPIVVLTVDSLRVDEPSGYGGTGVETPHIDTIRNAVRGHVESLGTTGESTFGEIDDDMQGRLEDLGYL